jgi:chromate transporter
VSQSIYFSRAIGEVLCSFVGLLLTVTFRFSSNISWDLPHTLLASAAFAALLLKIELIWIVLMGTVIALLFL